MMKNKKSNVKWWFMFLAVMLIVPLCVIIKNPTDFSSAASFEPSLSVWQNYENISLVGGDLSNKKVSSSEDAFELFDSLKSTFKFSSSKEALSFDKSVDDIDGVVFRFNQVYGGVRVYGAQLNVSVNSKGYATSISGRYYFNLNFDATENFSIDEARESLEDDNELTSVEFIETVYYVDESSAYKTYVFLQKGLVSSTKAFVSARTLKLVQGIDLNSGFLTDSLPTSGYSISQEETIQRDASGEDVGIVVDKYSSQKDSSSFYILGDSSRNIWVTDGLNKSDYTYKYYKSEKVSGDFFDSERDPRYAIQAFEDIMKCYDFFADADSFGSPIVGLKNYLGEPIKLIAIVHFAVNEENASFSIDSKNPTVGYFTFGDGKLYQDTSKSTTNFVMGLDVVGHEYMHCISDSINILEYANEAGALSEAYSDIFGAAIEGHDISTPDFWRMGEDLFIYSNRAFRDMSNPGLYGCTSSYDRMYPLCNKNHTHGSEDCDDNGGVHYNCTLMTYATYRMYCQNPEFFNVYNILRLWLKTLPKLSETATFVEFANAMVQSARELDGGTWKEDYIDAIKTAFAEVNIPGYEMEETWGGNTLAPLQGEGTVANPYIIKNESNLASAMYYINNNSDDYYRIARYYLAANIDLGNIPWIPIGTSERPFNGVFNGNGYTIENLNLNNSEQNFNGLFGQAGEDAYIVNLNIGSGKTSSGAKYTGAIVGRLLGTINTCSSNLSITGQTVGGLVGAFENNSGGDKITNCYASSTLDGSVVGGLAGVFATSSNNSDSQHKSGVVSASYFSGEVKGDLVGGFFGKANGVILVNNISVATLSGTTEGGYIGTIAFKSVLSQSDIVNKPVLNYFLNCYYAGRDEGLNFGILFASVDNMAIAAEGNIVIEKCTVKKLGNNEKLYFDSNKSLNITEKGVVYSSDELYSGAFDFDNIKFFKDEKNFISFEGAGTFDTATYRVNAEKTMPVFVNTYFWINFTENFAGGNGSEHSPYQIANAEQLAFLAQCLIEDNYSRFADKYYVLTSDIDLEGRLWVGIGFTLYHIIENNGVLTTISDDSYIRPFSGNFNGNGHTIFNMNSVGAMRVASIDTRGYEYYLYDYATGLFGLTANSTKGTTPKIYNLKIEDCIVQGSQVGGLIAEAIDDVEIDGVTVLGGKLASSEFVGGLVGVLGGSSMVKGNCETKITNSFVHTDMSGKVVGGAVGFAGNGNAIIKSSLTISNFLLRGTTRLINADFGDDWYEKQAVYGGLVGISAIDRLNVINNILFGDACGYTNNVYFGGFVGMIGGLSGASSKSMEIELKGNKLVSTFSSALSGYEKATAFGTLAGVINSGANISRLSIYVSDNNHTNLDGVAIYENSSLAGTLDNNMVYENSPAYEGSFAFYDKSLYTNSKYYDQNQEQVWTDELIERIYFTLVFLDGDGTVIKTITLKENEVLKEDQIPTATKEASKVNVYTFTGWDKSLESITRSMTLRPEFTSSLRSYEVKYMDEDGNVIETKVLPYGSAIDQSVEAPTKKATLFVSYKFVRWGEKRQIVDGDIEVYATYRKTLTGFSIALIIFGVLIVLGVGGGVAFMSKKKVKRTIDPEE